MLDHEISLTNAAIKSMLMSTAVDWGPSGSDNDYGAGRLDAFAAIKAVGGTTLGAPPTAPSHLLLGGSLAGAGDAAVHSVEVPTTEFPIAATLLMTTFAAGQPDFDLFLVAPDGRLLLCLRFDTRQEEVGARAGDPRHLFPQRSVDRGQWSLPSWTFPGKSPPPPPQPPQPAASASAASAAASSACGTSAAATARGRPLRRAEREGQDRSDGPRHAHATAVPAGPRDSRLLRECAHCTDHPPEPPTRRPAPARDARERGRQPRQAPPVTRPSKTCRNLSLSVECGVLPSPSLCSPCSRFPVRCRGPAEQRLRRLSPASCSSGSNAAPLRLPR